jgi:uncharacterized membrane protein
VIYLSVESSSSLGGVGAIFVALTSILSSISLLGTFFPGASFAFPPLTMVVGGLGLVGLILLLVSMSGLAKAYQLSAIFDNMLYALFSIIGGVVIVLALAVALIFFNLGNFTLASPTITDSFPQISQIMIEYLIPVFVAGAAVGIVSTLFLMRAFNSLANKSNVTKFRMAARLFPVSAVVSIVFVFLAVELVAAGIIQFDTIGIVSLPGGAVQLAAWIVAAQAFFSLRARSRIERKNSPQIIVARQQPATEAKYCSYCGSQNVTNAVYCMRCGKQLQ